VAMRIVALVLNDAGDACVDLIDGGGGANGIMEVWSGAQPTNVTDAPAGTLLAEVDFQNPAFGATGASVAGEAEALGVPIATTGLDDGTIGFIRVVDTGQDDAGGLWDDDDVGTAATRVIFNTLTVATGVDFSLDSYTWTVVPTTA